MPRLIPHGRQHPAGTGPGRAGDNAGFGPIPQVVTREQGISSASAGRGRQHAGVLVVPVAGGEVDNNLAGQLGGQGRAASSAGGHQHPASGHGKGIVAITHKK